MQSIALERQGTSGRITRHLQAPGTSPSTYPKVLRYGWMEQVMLYDTPPNSTQDRKTVASIKFPIYCINLLTSHDVSCTCGILSAKVHLEDHKGVFSSRCPSLHFKCCATLPPRFVRRTQPYKYHCDHYTWGREPSAGHFVYSSLPSCPVT